MKKILFFIVLFILLIFNLRVKEDFQSMVYRLKDLSMEIDHQIPDSDITITSIVSSDTRDLQQATTEVTQNYIECDPTGVLSQTGSIKTITGTLEVAKRECSENPNCGGFTNERGKNIYYLKNFTNGNVKEKTCGPNDGWKSYFKDVSPPTQPNTAQVETTQAETTQAETTQVETTQVRTTQPQAPLDSDGRYNYHFAKYIDKRPSISLTLGLFNKPAILSNKNNPRDTDNYISAFNRRTYTTSGINGGGITGFVIDKAGRGNILLYNWKNPITIKKNDEITNHDLLLNNRFDTYLLDVQPVKDENGDIEIDTARDNISGKYKLYRKRGFTSESPSFKTQGQLARYKNGVYYPIESKTFNPRAGGGNHFLARRHFEFGRFLREAPKKTNLAGFTYNTRFGGMYIFFGFVSDRDNKYIDEHNPNHLPANTNQENTETYLFEPEPEQER